MLNKVITNGSFTIFAVTANIDCTCCKNIETNLIFAI